jgi:hypothetical protein
LEAKLKNSMKKLSSMQHDNKVVQMPLDFELNDKDNIKTNSLKILV